MMRNVGLRAIFFAALALSSCASQKSFEKISEPMRTRDSVSREQSDVARLRRVREESPERAPWPAKPSLVVRPRVEGGESWLCEVEANSKVFTGSGSSREEALGSARGICSSHFQAAHCTESSCEKAL